MHIHFLKSFRSKTIVGIGTVMVVAASSGWAAAGGGVAHKVSQGVASGLECHGDPCKPSINEATKYANSLSGCSCVCVIGGLIAQAVERFSCCVQKAVDVVLRTRGSSRSCLHLATTSCEVGHCGIEESGHGGHDGHYYMYMYTYMMYMYVHVNVQAISTRGTFPTPNATSLSPWASLFSQPTPRWFVTLTFGGGATGRARERYASSADQSSDSE